ncbi:EF-hand calcium-binding domain-containing protein 1-like [Pecten maximus]|uniref:EF-hand calcium-binding domain-containing protein 1-like n=1 Tax=Pecten maximus TaxID=6579 RepID=UPI001457EE83|nr:EF-hand calcium-binding domain-containing protein 1-like [Pecten maximus]
MSRSKPKAKMVEDLAKKTRFKKDAVQCLLMMFREYATEVKNADKPQVDKSKFRDMLQAEFSLTDNVLMDRVFQAFDMDRDTVINEEEWVVGFSVYLSKELDEKKLKFMFRVYDFKDEGSITRESMFYFLKDSFVWTVISEEDADEAPKDLVEIVLKKMDLDKDQRVSYEDFAKVVKEEPLLLEFLGQCLPEAQCVDRFCTLLTGDKSPWTNSKPTKCYK